MRKVASLTLMVVLGFVMINAVNQTSLMAAEQRLAIEVQANYIKMPANVDRVPIRAVRIRSSSLRNTLKSLGATHMERVYEMVSIPGAGEAEQEVPDSYIVVFPVDADVAGSLSSIQGVDIVEAAFIQ